MNLQILCGANAFARRRVPHRAIIADENMEPPTPERLEAAAATLAASYPAGDVTLYLSTLVWQDPDTWGALTEALATP